MISRYLQLIGILRWAIKLGRIDIALETALMSQYSALPREGHLEAVVYHIFAYLATHSNGRIVFNATTLLIDEDCFQHDVDWSVYEEEPIDMPAPLGLPVKVYCALWMQIMPAI
jgi:hypothetical protein